MIPANQNMQIISQERPIRIVDKISADPGEIAKIIGANDPFYKK